MTAALEVDIVVEQLRRSVPGGIGTYCLGLLQGLAALPEEQRPHVTLHASRRPGARPGALATDPLESLGWPLCTSMLPGRALTRVWDLGIPAGWLKRRPTARGGLVHATSLAVPPVHTVPVVAMVHDLAWRRFPEAYPRRGRAWHERAMRRVAGLARLFVVPSELTAGDLLAAGLGVREEQVRLVPEGVDHLVPPDDAAADQLLARIGLEHEAGFLLTVGTLEPRKNLARLVEAYGMARPKLPEPWPLVVVGPRGWSGGDGAVTAPGVLLTGPLDPGVLAALYARARSMVYVPMFEGFGLPAAEAMLSGAPVVASTGLPSTGDAALSVDPTDVAAMASALVLASVDGLERERLRAVGERHARTLTWRRCAASHAEAWREAAG